MLNNAHQNHLLILTERSFGFQKITEGIKSRRITINIVYFEQGTAPGKFGEAV